MAGLQLTHTYHDRVSASYDGQPLFEYVYMPQGPATESLKPYFSPLYTLAGDDVTIYRPHDHPWHKGLQMTLTVVNDQNFWGGNTYVPEADRQAVATQGAIRAESGFPFDPGTDSYALLDNIGRTEHDFWMAITCEENVIFLEHMLSWVTSRGETWLREQRRLTVQKVSIIDGYWVLEWASIFTNESGIPLEIGSPTTLGRPNAGYGGLFWRGPRSFADSATIIAEGGLAGDTIMGQRAKWLAYSGLHDGTLRHSTLIFQDMPQNPRYPTQWFVRAMPFACASMAFMFDEVYVMQPADRLNLRYRITIANGTLTTKQIIRLCQQLSTESR
ncbi:MAG: PmoA family protein [Chloroflexota bacterium]